MNKPTGFELVYQKITYSWAKLQELMPIEFAPSNDDNIILLESDERFRTVLGLIYAYQNNKAVFPAKAGFSLAKQWKTVNINDFNLIIATSGTGSKAKLAKISQHNILSHCKNLAKVIQINQQSLWLNCLPLHHIAGVMIIYRCWFYNARVMLHDQFDAALLWHDLNKYPVTHISLVPIMMTKLLDIAKDKAPPAYLKYVIVGGDKMSNELFDRAVKSGWPIYISYGMTETTSTIALGRRIDQLTLLPELQADLTSENTLKIKGPMVIDSYINLQSSNKEWFVTQDIVEINNGFLNIIGRNDFQIISGGKNIAPEMIEHAIKSILINQKIAIGKIRLDNTSDWGDTIVLLVAGADVKSITSRLENNIASTYRPREIIACKTIPKNAMGKIDRKAVQKIINEYFL